MTSVGEARGGDCESEPGGAERFQRLPAEAQARYVEHASGMTTFARDHAVPIMIAPPVRIGGKINGGTGFILNLYADSFVVTASHVLQKYEERVENGEMLNWQVGKLPPFDPLSRIAGRDPKRDVVVLSLSPEEE